MSHASPAAKERLAFATELGDSNLSRARLLCQCQASATRLIFARVHRYPQRSPINSATSETVAPVASNSPRNTCAVPRSRYSTASACLMSSN